MKIESTAFTQSDLLQFLDDLLDHERMELADRLEKASARLSKIGPRIEAGQGAEAWSHHEVLAHIAVLSKFYGVLLHRISSGQVTEVDLLANTTLRDVAGEQMAAIQPSELLGMVATDHARTIKLLRTVDPTALRREAKLPDGTTVTAEFLARFPLINHLETHVDQLESALS